ncbi:hypothetical protein M011DRAFT_490673 [Sporormia fimetaria CBS 119925]|uniref:Extracellular membrane protein CFEM domain-containing protein n=1 Tax=Sporormia fimetaria CBS 119925 TaxID=1340428 RepID=A0A6A6UZ81_9PLEO|nr:hypothetical protein M011DRAFT_490673 [Sporormia fimetaria CBS 119925]
MYIRFIFVFAGIAVAQRVKSPDRTPDNDDSPNTPNQSPDDDSGGGGGGWNEVWEPANYNPLDQQVIQLNMGVKETEIKEERARSQVDVPLENLLKGKEEAIVSAILSTPTCTWEVTATATPSLVGGFGEDDEPELVGGFGENDSTTRTVPDCTSAKFTPTTTLPAASFAACTDYAKAVSSCASATPGFYQQGAPQQASCLCYSTPTETTIECTGTVTPIATANPSLNFAVDENASLCHGFFEKQGYENVAKVLEGRIGEQPALGANFCKNVDEDLKGAGGNSSLGLSQTIEDPRNFQVCAPQPRVVGSGNRVELRECVVIIGVVFMALMPVLVL